MVKGNFCFRELSRVPIPVVSYANRTISPCHSTTLLQPAKPRATTGTPALLQGERFPLKLYVLLKSRFPREHGDNALRTKRKRENAGSAGPQVLDSVPYDCATSS